MTETEVGVVGPGNMGGGAARNLQKAGIPLMMNRKSGASICLRNGHRAGGDVLWQQGKNSKRNKDGLS